MISSRAGGCTFAEDPAQSCAIILPIWSAAVDPRVLTVRAIKPVDGRARLFDARHVEVRIVRAPQSEHLLIDCGGDLCRLDVVEGTVAAGPVALRFDLADDDRLGSQIAVIKTFRAAAASEPRYGRVARRLLALHAVDARDAGASLRETADILFGPGEWPGDGEHRKSLVRRLLVAGERFIREGPRAILNTT